MESLITIDNVTKLFPGEETPALDGISAKISSGKIVGLVGPDGAGKTTLIRLLTGLLLPTQGKITVLGYDTRTEAYKIEPYLGYMPQKFGLYEDLTVIENLNFYAQLHGIRGEEKEAAFKRMLYFTNLGDFTDRLTGKLSGGMKQKLGLACALLSHPKILLLDEPSVGVDPISRRELWKMVQELTTQGIAIVWATAYLDEAERCGEVILINEGKLIFDGPPEKLTHRVDNRVYQVITSPNNKRKLLRQLLDNDEVVDGVVQGDKLRIVLKTEKLPEAIPDAEFIKTEPRFEDAFIDVIKGHVGGESELADQMHYIKPGDKPPVQAINLTKEFGAFTAVQDINFLIKRGEIFGLLGPNGAGKSTTFKMMCGLLQPTHGQALVSGLDLKHATYLARARIGYMAQKFSLYGDLSALQNLQFFSGIYGLSGKEQAFKVNKMIDIFELQHFKNTTVSLLSLGYKQRLALACATMHDPDVLFLDEPTSGVDPLTRREFWNHINGMIEKGITIMVTTHFMEEAEYCDRIALIYRGESIACASPDELKQSIRSAKLPDPTLEDTFIELIQRWDAIHHPHEVLT
jgi:ABC-2 type transport system ATP-binding protein